MTKLLMRFLRFLLLGLVFLLGGLAVVWTAGALYFDLPAAASLRTVAAIAWTLAAALFGTFFGWRGRVGVLLAFLLILGWWVTLTPRQDRDWQPSVAKLAYATREGDHITVHDIRNFEYRSAADFTPRYETREYDLANLHELDLFINYWARSSSPIQFCPSISVRRAVFVFRSKRALPAARDILLLPGFTGSMNLFTSPLMRAMWCGCAPTLNTKTSISIGF